MKEVKESEDRIKDVRVINRQFHWRPLEEVQERITADSLDCWDTVVARKELALKDGCLAFDQYGEERRLTPSRWATGQLCALLGIPAPYFRKCPSILQDVQANYWLKANPSKASAHKISAAQPNSIGEAGDSGCTDHYDDQGDSEQGARRWKLRARGETLRAVLSERYTALDHRDLMGVLRPMVDSRLQVDWFALSDEGLHLRIIDPERAREVLRGDELSVGIHIANSEVGFRALTVDALVYRLVCSNGLIRLVKGKSLLRQRHIHIQTPRFASALEAAIGAAWQEADSFIEQMKRTTLMPVEDVESTLGKLGERWNLSEPVRDDLLQSLRREPSAIQETVYGVVNAMTNVAQRLPDESRYDMEVLAGHLAQHGLGAFGTSQYAPKRRAMAPTISTKQDEQESNEDEGAEDKKEVISGSFDSYDPVVRHPSEFDPVAIAAEMFEAQEVHRQPKLAQPLSSNRSNAIVAFGEEV